MKKLQNIEESKLRIMQQAKKKIKEHQPNNSFNWRILTASIVVFSLMLFGTIKLISLPTDKNTSAPMDGIPLLENIQSIQIQSKSTNETVLITDALKIEELHQLISNVFKSGSKASQNESKAIYIIQFHAADFNSQNHVSISNGVAYFLGMEAQITEKQYEIIQLAFQENLTLVEKPSTDDDPLVEDSLEPEEETGSDEDPLAEKDEDKPKKDEYQLFEEKGGKFYLYGLTLGDTKSTVINRLGEQYSIYPEKSYTLPADTIWEYPSMRIYMLNNQITAIILDPFLDADKNKMIEASIPKGFVYEIDYGSGKVNYLYNATTNHLFTIKKDPGWPLTLMFTYADGNFIYHLESEQMKHLQP